MRKRGGIRQGDVTKLIKAAVVVGFQRPRVLVQPDGTLLLECDPGTPSEPTFSAEQQPKLRTFNELFDG
jgi:hypothetical protein